MVILNGSGVILKYCCIDLRAVVLLEKTTGGRYRVIVYVVPREAEILGPFESREVAEVLYLEKLAEISAKKVNELDARLDSAGFGTGGTVLTPELEAALKERVRIEIADDVEFARLDALTEEEVQSELLALQTEVAAEDAEDAANGF